MGLENFENKEKKSIEDLEGNEKEIFEYLSKEWPEMLTKLHNENSEDSLDLSIFKNEDQKKNAIAEAEKNNQSFEQNFNSPHEHETDWHEFGIVEHSRQTVIWLKKIIKHYPLLLGINDSSLVKEVNGNFDAKIGNKTKRELFFLSGFLHDLGKFAARKFDQNEDGSIQYRSNGKPKFSFKNHEKRSGEIVEEKGGIVRKDLEKMGFDDQQIKYLADCSRFHFELGSLRAAAKKWENAKGEKAGFCEEFIESDDFDKGTLEIIRNNPEYKWEIGVFYLADSLAKHSRELRDLRKPLLSKTRQNLNMESSNVQIIDEKIDRELKKIILEQSGFSNTNILKGVEQLRLNMMAAKKYLGLCIQFEKQQIAKFKNFSDEKLVERSNFLAEYRDVDYNQPDYVIEKQKEQNQREFEEINREIARREKRKNNGVGVNVW
jgi:hypothetical protein